MTFFDLERPDHAYMFAFLQADGHLAQGTGNKGSGAASLELAAEQLERTLKGCAIRKWRLVSPKRRGAASG
ncbi:hypothetical protein ACIGZJ_25455 [Kitasatospora sp. NPDC052868]|uniref:hypothetical protein n=1 Tax=Kitasatospora sp. NPDC052868 TaxID=3364060 RepID=UPI0037C87EC6